jgi:hypothetical protein
MFKWLMGFVNGRTTGFSIAFFVMGHVAHFLHRLDTTYIGYMSVLMGFIVGHSVKEDLQARFMSGKDVGPQGATSAEGLTVEQAPGPPSGFAPPGAH